MKLTSIFRLFLVLTTMFVSYGLSAQSDSAVWPNTTKVPAGFGYPTTAFDSAGLSSSGLTAKVYTLANMGVGKTLKPKIDGPYDITTYSMNEFAPTDTGSAAVAASAGIWEANPTSTGNPSRYIQFDVTVNSALYITSIKAPMVSSGGSAVTADFYYSTDGWATSNLLVLGSNQKLSKDTIQTFTLSLPNTLQLTKGQTFSLRLLPFNKSTAATTGKLLGFEDFVIYANPTPLPVTFAGVSATLTGSDVKVSWIGENEINVASYVIESSADGKNFSTFGTVAADNSVNYSYTGAASTGVSYYRVKSVDKDGAVGYSSIVAVTVAGAGVKVYPNPVTNQQLYIDGLAAGKYIANFYSVTGQKVATSSITVSGLAQLSLPAAVKAGIYQLELVGSTRVTKTIFVK